MSGAVEGVEPTDTEFLRDLAARLFRTATPAMGFDQGDTDRLHRIARDLTTPPARSYADEDVARIIDPGAWMDHTEFTRKSAEEPGRDRANEWLAAAEQSVAKSLAKAAAIRLLSQEGNP